MIVLTILCLKNVLIIIIIYDSLQKNIIIIIIIIVNINENLIEPETIQVTHGKRIDLGMNFCKPRHYGCKIEYFFITIKYILN